jgi:hypothetical protein
MGNLVRRQIIYKHINSARSIIYMSIIKNIICILGEIMHRNGLVNNILINLHFLLVSPFRQTFEGKLVSQVLKISC